MTAQEKKKKNGIFSRAQFRNGQNTLKIKGEKKKKKKRGGKLPEGKKQFSGLYHRVVNPGYKWMDSCSCVFSAENFS